MQRDPGDEGSRANLCKVLVERYRMGVDVRLPDFFIYVYHTRTSPYTSILYTPVRINKGAVTYTMQRFIEILPSIRADVWLVCTHTHTYTIVRHVGVRPPHHGSGLFKAKAAFARSYGLFAAARLQVPVAQMQEHCHGAVQRWASLPLQQTSMSLCSYYAAILPR